MNPIQSIIIISEGFACSETEPVTAGLFVTNVGHSLTYTHDHKHAVKKLEKLRTEIEEQHLLTEDTGKPAVPARDNARHGVIYR